MNSTDSFDAEHHVRVQLITKTRKMFGEIKERGTGN